CTTAPGREELPHLQVAEPNAEAQVGRERRLDHGGALERDIGPRDIVEQTLACSEQQRRERQVNSSTSPAARYRRSRSAPPITMTFLPAAAAWARSNAAAMPPVANSKV